MADQLDLGDLDSRRPVGRVEQHVRSALEAAELDPRDAGAGELAAGLGRAVDLALGRRDPYAVAAAGRELSHALERLRLDPVSRGAAAGNAWDALRSELNRELDAGAGTT